MALVRAISSAIWESMGSWAKTQRAARRTSANLIWIRNRDASRAVLNLPKARACRTSWRAVLRRSSHPWIRRRTRTVIRRSAEGDRAARTWARAGRRGRPAYRGTKRGARRTPRRPAAQEQAVDRRAERIGLRRRDPGPREQP